MKKLLFFLLVALFALTPVSAGDLPIPLQAKFVKLFIQSGGSSASKIHCTNPELLEELKKNGVAHDSASPMAWASNEAEVKQLKSQKKLVICGKLELLSSGGAIAIVEEGGKPQFYLHVGNVAASGIVLSDTILKIGKKL